MENWKSIYPKLPYIDNAWEPVRKKIQKIYKAAEEKNLKKYKLDVYLGLSLYEYLNNIKEFEQLKNEIGFWYFLSLKVAPDVVAKRWGYKNEGHYYKRNTRVWFYTTWKYIDLSWQGSISKTEMLINKPRFDTDIILNLVERPGKDKCSKRVSRILMKKFGELPEEYITSYRNEDNKRETLFRCIMKRRLEYAEEIDEMKLKIDEEEEYVKMLFDISFINKYEDLKRVKSKNIYDSKNENDINTTVHETSDDIYLENIKKKAFEKSEINKKAEHVEVTMVKRYSRDADIAEYAKILANGICQLCKKAAPFKDKDNKPFLEAHHVKWLSNGGKDTVDNVIALCPNCHKRIHILENEEDTRKLQDIINSRDYN